MRGRPRGEPPKSDEPVSDDLPTLFGKNLREAWIKGNLTQAPVAERTGLTQQYVSPVEAGHQNITLDTMAALARAVGRDVSALLRKHVTVSGRDNLRSSGAANEVRASVRLIVCGRSVEPDPGELAGYYGAQTTVLRVAREAHLLPV